MNLDQLISDAEKKLYEEAERRGHVYCYQCGKSIEPGEARPKIVQPASTRESGECEMSIALVCPECLPFFKLMRDGEK